MPSIYDVFIDHDKCLGVLEDPNGIRDLYNRWFGRVEDNKLYLEIVEIAYLLLKSRIRIRDHGEVINSLELFMNKFYDCIKEFFWPKLVVYKDLRDRGRRVRVLKDNEFLVKDKYGDLRLVVVLEEGRNIDVDELTRWISKARDNNLIPVLAIVSLQGDLTYYEISSINLRRE